MRTPAQWLVTDIRFAFDTRNRDALEHALRKVERIDSLFDAITHGSNEHRAWLKKAIDDHFAGKPAQPIVL